MEVVAPGLQTSVQDWPGRTGLWHVGVPPSGPMDSLAHRLANALAGNDEDAASELGGSCCWGSQEASMMSVLVLCTYTIGGMLEQHVCKVHVKVSVCGCKAQPASCFADPVDCLCLQPWSSA